MFVSTFYSTRDALGQAFVMPTFDAFAERLTREKDKLIQKDSLSSIDSKYHALVSISPSNSRMAHKNVSKGKQTHNIKSDNSSHFSPKPDSKGKKNLLKCALYGKDGHLESHSCKKLAALSSE